MKSSSIPLRVFGMLVLLAAGASGQPLLDHSIVGTASCSAGVPCYGETISEVPVQRFLLDLAKGPIAEAEADRRFAAEGIAGSDLLTLGLIRREGGRYVLDFPLFTAGDVRRIREVSERYATSLAASILARRAEIDTALGTYDAPGVPRDALAYFVLGCVSLDWDGLELTAREGYRNIGQTHVDGVYVPAAEEKTERSLERIYWGSHTVRADGIGFTSFGDHASRRFAFPDLLWVVPSRVQERSGDPAGGGDALRAVASSSLELAASSIARMMIALREREATSEELATAAKIPPDRAESLLAALDELAYVECVDGRYRARIPLLAERDAATIDALRVIGREEMRRWLAANYPRIRTELRDLSFTRSGVPFEDGFTMIWHYIFGLTNRVLVERGLFADPYAPERRFKGSIPAVYAVEFELP